VKTYALLASGLIAALLAVTPAGAQQVDTLQNLSQTQFRLLSEDLGGVLSYKGQTPTTPLGLTGFDLGIAVTASKIQNLAVLEAATSNKANSTVYVPTLRLHKGLPLGFDIGAMYASIPNSNIKYYGGELRYAIIQGGVAAPAVGLRGSISKLAGVEQLELDTRGIDLSISKGFTVFTPYAGIGKVWVNSTPRGTAVSVAGLREEDFSLNKVFFGLGSQFVAFNINLEADKTGDVKSYSIKMGFRF
jgi:hypothetical protein